MLLFYTKYFFITLCSLYLYRKLLYIRTDKNSYCMNLLLSLLLPLFLYPVRVHINAITFLIPIISLTVFISFYHKLPVKVSIVSATLAFGLAYIAETLATLFTMPLEIGFLLFSFHGLFFDFLTYVVSGCLGLLLIRVPFFMKRFKKGMPFLQNETSINTGFLLSLLLLSAITAYRVTSFSKTKLFIYFVCIFVCTTLLFFWWFKRLKASYIEKLKIKEIESLKREIKDLQEEVADLKRNNNDLSKIIHKDNKLIPAMEHVVMTLSDRAVFPDGNVKKQATDLLNTLNALSKERSGILTSYKNTYHHPTQTGVISVDAMCQYMEHKALAMGISFHFNFIGSVKYLVDALIDENTLTTLIADLSENALISMKESSGKSALLSLCIENNIYVLSIYDSGVAFDVETLKHFGFTRTTTHAGDGGSGIGLMTIYEILKKHNASFLLDETITTSSYTKVISVSFDGLNEIRIKSRHPEVKALDKVRNDFNFL